MTVEIIVTDNEDRDDTDDDYHLIPQWDVAGHVVSRRCPCRPLVERIAAGYLVQHRERN